MIKGVVYQKLNRLLESDSESADDEPLEKLKQSLEIMFGPSKSKAGKKHGRKKTSDVGRQGLDTAASSEYKNGSVSDDHKAAKEYGGSEQEVEQIVRDIWDVADAAVGCMIENDSTEAPDSSDNRRAKKVSQRREQKIRSSLVRGFEERYLSSGHTLDHSPECGSEDPANAKESDGAALSMVTVREKGATRRNWRYGGDKDADISVKFMDVYGDEEYIGGDVYEGTDTPLIVADRCIY